MLQIKMFEKEAEVLKIKCRDVHCLSKLLNVNQVQKYTGNANYC
jgi:hypothetical protein